MEQQSGLYDSQAPQILAVIITLPTLAVIAVVLRLYTRIELISNTAFDDWCIIIAMAFSIGVSICQGYQVYYGMGRHIATLTEQQGLGSLKALFASIIVYNFGLLFTKLSIILQYLRVCATKPVTYACYAVMALIILYGIETFFTGLFTCYPIAFFWDPTIPRGTCLNESALWFANAGINIFTDLLLLTLPIFILKDLILPRRQKVSLGLILALGGFACIASILRLHALYIVTISTDITWDNPATAVWSTIELNVGIICTSISALKPLLWRLLPGSSSSTRSNGRQGYVRSNNKTRKGLAPDKSSPREAIDEITLHRDVEIGSIKHSLSSSDGRDDIIEEVPYIT